MYTRSYYTDENERISVPKNYDGSAFGGEGLDYGGASVQPSVAEPKTSPRDVPPFPEGESEATSAEEKVEETGAFGSLLSRLPFVSVLSNGLSGLFKPDKFKLGYEEILLIGIALFLFFSRDGDKECAIILLLLIFVN